MRNNPIGKQALSVLLCALVVFSSLGISPLTPQAQAEEAASGVSVMPRYKDSDGRVKIEESGKWYPNITFDFVQTGTTTTTTGNWSDNTDTSWYNADASVTGYTLYNASQLAGLAKLVNAGTANFSGKTITLGQSIDLSEHFWNEVNGSTESQTFNGIFDGNGYSLMGLRINASINNSDTSPGYIYFGLFGATGTTATIKNLTMDDSMISAINEGSAVVYISPIVTFNYGIIENCHVVDGRFYGNAQVIIVGGIAACNKNSMTNCTVSEQTVTYSVCEQKNTNVKMTYVALGGIVGDNKSNQTVKNCVNNGVIIGYTEGGDISMDSKRHFIGGCVGVNDGLGAKGQIANSTNNGNIEIHADGKAIGYTTGRGLLIGGITGVTATDTYGCVNTGEIYVDGAQKAVPTKGAVGGIAGAMNSGNIKYCYNSGKIITNHPVTAGVAGYMNSGNIEYCYNTGEIDTTVAAIPVQPTTQYVGGLAGYVNAGNVNGCYSVGTIVGEKPNDKDNKGGLTGKAGGTFTNCFYLGAGKASGDQSTASGKAINLAAIKDASATNVISQVKQGDDTAQVVLADATQLNALKTKTTLGDSFGVQMPTASAFSSDKPDVVQAVVGSGNTVNLKTSGGAGGQAAISAKMYLSQNELAEDTDGVRKFIGPVKSVETPISLNLNVVNVGLANQSPTSAISDVTSFSLKAGVTFGGTGVDETSYSLTWYKDDTTGQSTAPTGDGTEVTGLTATWDKTTNTVSWTRSAPAATTFAESDAGWYKLKATSAVSDLSAYSFETDWQYLSVDKFMVVDENSTMPDTIELSSQDTDADIQAKTKLSVKIKIADSFTGSVTYGWYKVDGQTPALIADTQKTTEITTDLATHTIVESITLGTAYSNDLKGAYQLMVTSVTATGDTAQAKDIRGPASKVTCYEAVIKDDYAQAGPGYEGTPGNTMTQSVITLSEDFADAMYDAYWIKGGTLDESTDLTDYTQVRHATLTQQADKKTYKAIATFNMEKGYEGEDYQLVIYPTNTARKARTDAAMQFKGAAGCVLERYAIDTVTYKLADSYATTEMAQNTAIIAPPSVSAPNPAGSLTYTKVSGPETFTVDKASGKILCAADPTGIPNGLYTYTIKVTEEGFKSGNAVLTGPGMSKTITVSFRVTGSSDFPLANNNLYIYDIGYIFANAEPANQAGLIPYQGIYNIPATNDGSAYAHSIIVVSGTHTDGSRIILNESINTADVPITVKADATAQVGVPDGQTVTVTNSSPNGASLQSDGSLRLTGGTAGTGVLNLPGSVAGSGSLTIGAADTVGLTLNAPAGLATASTTIESGLTTVTGSITGKATIKGGNVEANTIGTTGTTTIDGGSIIGSVTGAKNSSGETVYPVTLKLSENPTDYAGVPASVTTQKTKADGKADGTARIWNAQASGGSFNKTGGQTGELYVYLPKYSGGPYTAVTASATPAGGTAQTLSRKINADADGSLTTSLLTATYTLSLPKAPITGSARVGQGATANITVGVASNDGWLYEGRTIDLEISPGDGYKTIWGKYQMQPADTTAQGSYSPEFWIETPSGAALSKAGGFATLTENDRQNGKTGQLVVPADSKITEGTYKSQLNWKSIPNDPVVGGTN